MLKIALSENKFLLALLAGIFFLPFAYPLAQLGLYLSVLTLAVVFFKDRPDDLWASPWFGFIALFVFAALLSIFTGIDFWRSLDKSYRLTLFLVVFAIPYVVKQNLNIKSKLIHSFIGAYILGVAVLGLYDLIRIPLGVRAGVDFFDLGNMRDPQLYMVGLCFLSALLGGNYKPSLKRWGYVLFLLLLAGLVLHFKRGVWLSFGLVFFGAMILQRRYKLLAAGFFMVVLMLMVPQVQDRLMDLKNVANENRGGRLSLWTNVAPPLIKEYPFGIGYRAMRFDHLRRHHWDVSAGLNHLHNNVLQVTAELGWLGLVAWLYLMGGTLVLLFKLHRSLDAVDHAMRPCVLAVFLGLIALLINGMVESNFGDGEIFALYCIIFGISNALWLDSNAPSSRVKEAVNEG